jgi:hypothetical protein
MRPPRPTPAWTAIALGGALAAGCEATMPSPRNPSGPCLQLLHHRLGGRRSVATLWRGETLVGSDLGPIEVDAPLIAATADVPAANREARASHRAHVAGTAVLIGGLATSAALIATGPFVAPETHSDAAGIAMLVGAALSGLGALLGSYVLFSSGMEHRQDAVKLYNANLPPFFCGPPAADVAGSGSQ